LPHQLMAIPQWAITQRGSFFKTPVNASIAAEYQKEWSSAIP